MIFSLTSRRTMNPAQPMPLSTNKINYDMTRRPQPPQIPQPQYRQLPQPQPIVQKKMKWGEPTWFLLHTLCEKVKDENFGEARQGLLSILYTICTNLPCPECSSHAKTYLNNINWTTIQTKTQLKRVIFDLHNSLNIKMGFRQFNYN